MTETVLAYRKPGADQTEAEKVANAAADALSGRLVSDGSVANNPGQRAVVRRRATSATRQRTMRANGIDCGASSLGENHGLRGERLARLLRCRMAAGGDSRR